MWRENYMGAAIDSIWQVYETDTEVQMVLELLEGSDLFDRIINKQR